MKGVFIIKKLKIFIDESGDFGFSKNSSALYIASFVMYDSEKNIQKDINYLNRKLKELNFKGMIHINPLIAKRDEYNYMSYEERKKIFFTLFHFCTRLDIKIKTIIVNKKYVNNKYNLKKSLYKEINKMFLINKDYFNKFQQIIIYYDNGQEDLTEILKVIFSNVKTIWIEMFDHEKEKLFKIADLLTTIDKVEYKRKNKIKLSNNEKYFFEIDDLRIRLKQIKSKRLK